MTTKEKALEYAEMCIKDYGNGQWNFASREMAQFIKDSSRESPLVITEEKRKIRNAINLLRVMVNSGEEHSRESARAIEEAMNALEKL